MDIKVRFEKEKELRLQMDGCGSPFCLDVPGCVCKPESNNQMNEPSMTEGNVTDLIEKIESQEDDVAEVREVIENALWDGQALNVVRRAFMGEKLTDSDKDLFDEWKFNHSSDDVLALIGKTGTALAETVKAQADVIREMREALEIYADDNVLFCSICHAGRNHKGPCFPHAKRGKNKAQAVLDKWKEGK